MGLPGGSVSSTAPFGSGHDLPSLASSPVCEGSLLGGESSSPSPSAPPPACVLPLSQINEWNLLEKMKIRIYLKTERKGLLKRTLPTPTQGRRFLGKINKEVPGKSQLSHSFDSWMVSFPGQKCVQIWITSNSQMPYLKDDSQSLIFGLGGELKGVYVSEIIRVRHLKIKILCQPINIYECVKFPTAPFHNFHALRVERCLTPERDSISVPHISHLTLHSKACWKLWPGF